MYESLVHHSSWTRLPLKFIFDPSICLFSRQVGTERGRQALNVEPDVESSKLSHASACSTRTSDAL